MTEAMGGSRHTASDKISASIFDEVDEAFAASASAWRHPIMHTSCTVVQSPPYHSYVGMPPSLVANRPSYARTASSVSSQSQLSPLLEADLQQRVFQQSGTGWGRASDSAAERLFERQYSHQTAQADIFMEDPVVRQHLFQPVSLQRRTFQVGQVPMSDLLTQADYELTPTNPMISAGGHDGIHGQPPNNLQAIAPSVLQQLHGNLQSAHSARSIAESAAELEHDEQCGNQAQQQEQQQQQQRKSGSPTWRRGSCHTASDTRSVGQQGQQAGLTGTVSVRAKTGAGAASHADISRHRRHRRAAAGAASGFKSTARGWGPGDFIPKMRRTACRRAHSSSSHQSRQVAAGSQLLQHPSQRVHRQLLPAHKLKEQQQRPQQQQLRQSSRSPMSSASATSTAQNVQRLSFVTEGNRSLQPADDSTVRQVQLGPQAIGSSQLAQIQAIAAGQSVPPSCHRSSDNSQAQAQPERSVDVQPLTETACKEVQAETAETLQQVHTVHQLKQSRKRKATEDVDSDRVPKKVGQQGTMPPHYWHHSVRQESTIASHLELTIFISECIKLRTSRKSVCLCYLLAVQVPQYLQIFMSQLWLCLLQFAIHVIRFFRVLPLRWACAVL